MEILKDEAPFELVLADQYLYGNRVQNIDGLVVISANGKHPNVRPVVITRG